MADNQLIVNFVCAILRFEISYRHLILIKKTPPSMQILRVFNFIINPQTIAVLTYIIAA